MKKILFIVSCLVCLPFVGTAQVDKKVEVTKTYAPSVEQASKLRIKPDMTDTTKIRPDIDYTIIPLSMQTDFKMTPISPATVTYWEFNRPRRFYLKAGAGMPANSVLDFYASTQQKSTGYALGYINHEGRYDKLRNEFGVKNTATRMTNRMGAAAGKYFGRYSLEGDLSYENRMYHRFGAFAAEGQDDEIYGSIPASQVDFGDVKFGLRFGDDFQDLDRTNFDLALHGDCFFDHSDWIGYSDKATQTTLGADARVSHLWGAHYLMFHLGYEWIKGGVALNDFEKHTIQLGLRYQTERPIWQVEAGADYYYDKLNAVRSDWYILPYARLKFKLGTPHLIPFIEVDGSLHKNDYQSLTRQNPFLAPCVVMLHNSVDYRLRAGIAGSLWHDKFYYRIYGGVSLLKDNIAWLGLRTEELTDGLPLGAAFAAIPVRDDLTEASINFEAELRPTTSVHIAMGFSAFYFENDSEFESGRAKLKGNLAVRYEGRKFGCSISADAFGKQKWTILSGVVMQNDGRLGLPVEQPWVGDPFISPFVVDLRVKLDWKINARIGLFAEGMNLANQKIYRYPMYREHGAGVTVGVKMQF